MKIQYSKKAVKFLARQEKSNVERIKKAIIKLTHKPPEGDKSFTGRRKRYNEIESWRISYYFLVYK